MRLFGNVIWFIFGGWYLALTWLIGSLVFAITILGLPLTRAGFEMAKMSAFPFGKEVVHVRELDGKGFTVVTGISGPIGFIFNILWFLTFGWVLFLMNLIAGLSSCIVGCVITVLSLFILSPIGVILIAFGIQSFKLATISLWPVGRRIVTKEVAQLARQRNAKKTLDSMSENQSIKKEVINEDVNDNILKTQPIEKEVINEQVDTQNKSREQYSEIVLEENNLANKLYKKIKNISSSKATNKVLFGLSFAESIFFPIPSDPLLAACIIAQPRKIVFLTFFTILASVLGGIVGWLIGLSIGVGIYNLVDLLPGISISDLEQVNKGFANWGLMLTFIGAFTPLPYKLIAISAGATGVPLAIFILGSIFGRGIRFLIVAFLSYYLGEKAINFIKNNLALTTLVLGVIILILWFLII